MVSPVLPPRFNTTAGWMFARAVNLVLWVFVRVASPRGGSQKRGGHMSRLRLESGISVLFLISLQSKLGMTVVKPLVEDEALNFVALGATLFGCVNTC